MNRKNFNSKKLTLPREKFDLGYDMTEGYRWLENKQEEIARAKRAGNQELADQIGNEIVMSKFGQVVAVQIVSSNRGARSPGLSKESFRTNSDYLNMINKLEEVVSNPDQYKATPLDRLYIPKKDGSERPLSVPSYLDRCLQALYKLALEPFSEEVADISSYGFRPIRSTSWAVARILNGLSNPLAKYRYVVEVDIKGCFDNIDHDFVDGVTPLIPRKILWEWLKCGYVERYDRSNVRSTETGVPQGGILSPMLMNLVLDGLESFISIKIKNSSSISKGSLFCRYADDMVCFTTTSQTAQIALEAIKEFLSFRGLQVKEAKTRIIDIDHNSFEFVGFEFSRVFRRNRKRLSAKIGIPTSAVTNFRTKINKIINSKISLHMMIDQMNPIIRGWANYYRFAHTCVYVFRSLRYWIWKKYYKVCYKKAKNRFDKAKHLEINKFVLATYFHTYDNITHHPIIYDKMAKPHILFDITNVDYCSPTYTNRARNAFILEDSELLYAVNLRQKSRFNQAIFELHGSRCALCGKNLQTNVIPHELHHILPKRFGGKDRPNNLIPLCKSPCHKQVSSSVASLNIDQIRKYIKLGILEIPANYFDNPDFNFTEDNQQIVVD